MVDERGRACTPLPIEEGRVANKSPHYKFGYFLPISQQVDSADITKISAIAIFES
jgi:hypothetical protein